MGETDLTTDRKKKILTYLIGKVKDKKLNPLDFSLSHIKKHFSEYSSEDIENSLGELEGTESKIISRKVDVDVYLPIDYVDKIPEAKDPDTSRKFLIYGGLTLWFLFYTAVNRGWINVTAWSVSAIFLGAAVLTVWMGGWIGEQIDSRYYWLTKKISESIHIDRRAFSTISISLFCVVILAYLYAAYISHQNLTLELFLLSMATGTGIGVALWQWVIKK